MTTINPCKVLRTGDEIETSKGKGIIHYLYDKDGHKVYDLPMRLIDHSQVLIKNKLQTVYQYELNKLGE